MKKRTDEQIVNLVYPTYGKTFEGSNAVAKAEMHILVNIEEHGDLPHRVEYYRDNDHLWRGEVEVLNPVYTVALMVTPPKT